MVYQIKVSVPSAYTIHPADGSGVTKVSSDLKITNDEEADSGAITSTSEVCLHARTRARTGPAVARESVRVELMCVCVGGGW